MTLFPARASIPPRNWTNEVMEERVGDCDSVANLLSLHTSLRLSFAAASEGFLEDSVACPPPVLHRDRDNFGRSYIIDFFERRRLSCNPRNAEYSNMALPPFQWAELLENEIRICDLLDGADDVLHLRLHHHPLGPLPYFHAISYAAGQYEPSNVCVCEDQYSRGTVLISDNLYLALKQFRKNENSYISIWADQICINQKDSAEKAQQIRQMKHIYHRALKVLVWLGPSDDDTKMVFDLINDTLPTVVDQIEKIGVDRYFNPENHYHPTNRDLERYPLDLTSPDSPEWVAFRKLFERPWFERLWTFQEAVLAREAAICCGGFAISWDTLWVTCMGVGAYDKLTRIWHSHLKNAHYQCFIIAKIRSGITQNTDKAEDPMYPKQPNLLSLMEISIPRKATDPRDKIYGLLGIAQDVDASQFPVDYEQHFRDAYQHLTRFFIQQHSDLNVLKLVSIGPSKDIPKQETRELPSWIPDYRGNEDEENGISGVPAFSHNGVLMHGRDRRYYATGGSKVILTSDDKFRLTLQGLRIGHIVSLSELDGNLQPGGDGIGDNVQYDGQWAQLATTCAREGIYETTGELIGVAYARLQIKDYVHAPGEYDSAGRRIRPRGGVLRKEPERSYVKFDSEPDEVQLDLQTGDLADHILAATTGQRLFITNEGYMGLAHRSCMVGDEVWLLMGGDMPFVLRRLDTGTHHFKGEAYVHGIMDGEVLLTIRRLMKGGGGISDGEWLDSLGDGLPFPTETVVLT